MSNIPVMYDYINTKNSQFIPSTIHTTDNVTSLYFNNYLFQRILAVFDFDIPKYWDKDYFLYVLFFEGFIGIVPGGVYGEWVPQLCTLKGHDIYYRPTNIIVDNPYAKELNNKNYKIGENAGLIKVQPNYHSVWDIVSLYSDMLAESLAGISSNLINSKFAYIFGAKNKATAEALKKMYDKIAAGEPAVFLDKKLFDDNGNLTVQLFQQEDVYNMGDRLADFRKILNMFDTEIGIPSVNYEKKERMIVDEVNANNVETESLSDIWLETLTDSINDVNSLTGLNLKVTKRYGGVNNEY